MDNNYNSDKEKSRVSFCDDVVFEAGMLGEYSDMLEAAAQAGIKLSEHTREFLHDIADTDYPDDTAHAELVQAILSGDMVAAAELSERDLRIALAAALRFYESFSDDAADDENLFPELLEEASFGLCGAVSEYSGVGQGEFRHFAALKILELLESFMSENADVKKLPEHISEMLSRISKSDMLLEEKLSREATPEEIAADTGYSVGEVEAIIEMMESLAEDNEETETTDDCCDDHDHHHVHYDTPNYHKN